LFPEDVIAHKVASTIQRLELCFVKENKGEKIENIYKIMFCCHAIYVER